MKRERAARLLGISPAADGQEAHRAFVAKRSELDGRIATAPSELLRVKYESLRDELKEALEVMQGGAMDGEAAEADGSDLQSSTPQSAPEKIEESAATKGSTADVSGEAGAPPSASPSTGMRIALVLALLTALAGAWVLGGLWESIRSPSQEQRVVQTDETSRLEAEIDSLQGRLQEMQRAVETEERRAHFQEAARLKAEIEILEGRLREIRLAVEAEKRDAENGVLRLEAQLRSAKTQDDRARNSSQLEEARVRLALVEKALELQERLVFAGERLTELQGHLAEAERLIDPGGDQNLAAAERLRSVRSGYEQLIERLGGLSARAQSWWESEAAFGAWAAFSSGKSLPKEEEQVSALRQRHTQADALSNDEEAIGEYREVAAVLSQLRSDAANRLQTEALEESKRPQDEPAQAEQDRWAGLAGQGIPEMVSIPGGRFRMGCSLEEECPSDENPAHDVTIPAFRLGKYEVTFAQYDAFAEATDRKKPDDRGWGRDDRPVINVSWDDAQAFVGWLSRMTGKRFRLPTEAEWEYAARGGTTTNYSWGDSVGQGNANCSGCGSEWDGRQTAPVGSFIANSFGLYDMHGNALEWVTDCWNDSYQGAPSDGSAWREGDCGQRVVRGGSWWANKDMARSARRHALDSSMILSMVGFRVAQDEP